MRLTLLPEENRKIRNRNDLHHQTDDGHRLTQNSEKPDVQPVHKRNQRAVLNHVQLQEPDRFFK